MANKITVSAPGKLMLLGEHAVVYDRPCLVTAVGQRMKATVELLDEPIFELEAPDVQVTSYKKPISELTQGEIPKGAKFVEYAIKNFIDVILENAVTPESKKDAGQVEDARQVIDSHMGGASMTRLKGFKITTSSEFSAEFGFGSSSASTVCTIKALSELTGTNLDQKAVFDLAYKTVLDIQGKGSGFDVAVAVYGGTLYFVTGGKVIEPLDVTELPMVIGYSGIKADTITLVNEVAKKAEKYPEVIAGIYDQITNLVERAKSAILQQNWATLGELMNINQGLLAALGVESHKLADMIYAARETGAYGAKLSGAGIGDCMLALSDPELAEGESKRSLITKAIEKVDGKVIDVSVNVEGVRIEANG